MLSPATIKTQAPPGLVPTECEDGVNIIICSLMRSGTHLLIDFILNNFKEYRHNPLLVDFDRLEDLAELDKLLKGSNVIIKTHFPQIKLSPEKESMLRQLCENSILISPHRDFEAIWKSAVKFGVYKERKEFDYDLQSYQKWWSDYEIKSVAFQDLVSRSSHIELLNNLAEILTKSPSSRWRLYCLNKVRFFILFNKTLTRLFGKCAPIINTGIGYKK